MKKLMPTLSMLLISVGCLNADEKSPQFFVDVEKGCIVCIGIHGKKIWSTPLTDVPRLVRSPHIQWDKKRVYVSQKGGIVACDAGTGKILWHCKGPSDRLLLDGALLISVDCTSKPKNGRWLLARDVEKGETVFKVKLPTSDFDAYAIRKIGRFFLVQSEGCERTAIAFLIDYTGKICHVIDRLVVDGKADGEDLVLLTTTDVCRLPPDGKIRWSLTFGRPNWVCGGGLISFPGGELLGFRYSMISDSGVDLVRFSPTTGTVRWSAQCESVGKYHSKFTNNASVELDSNTIRVTNQGTGKWISTIVEVLDLESGRQIKRTVTFK
jgi:outer membrane protein assembly factor BamB